MLTLVKVKMSKEKPSKRTNGRPKIKSKLKRENHRFQLNCTADEFKYIEKNAKKFNISKSKFCLRIIMDKELPVLFQEDIADLNREIRRIGNNLNQMTKTLNELNNGGILSVFKRKSLQEDIDATIQEYREVLQYLMKIRS